MKNFLDLLDTKTEIVISIDLEPITHAGSPDIMLCVNRQEIYKGHLHHRWVNECRIDTRDAICVELSMSNKIYRSDLETAVIIRTLSCNGFDIVPELCHLATYTNDHHYDSPTCYLGFNGTWRLDTQRPFYEWRHEITNQGWLLYPS
jgi:hypothetical protein